MSYSSGWITVPGKGRRWRTAEGKYMMQRPAGDAPGVMGAIQGAWADASSRARNAAVEVDRRAGGLLPLGSPISSNVLNKMPPEINLGYRYMSGLGSKGLELPEDFKRGAVRLAEDPGAIWQVVGAGDTVKSLKPSNPQYGVIRPGETRAVNSYKGQGPLMPGYDTAGSAYGGWRPLDPNRAQAPYRYTLGRYNIEGTDKGYEVRDTFDLVNEYEDPDLTSRGRKPLKALRALAASALDPSQFVRAYGYMREKPMRSFPVEFTVSRQDAQRFPGKNESPRQKTLREMLEKGKTPKRVLTTPWATGE